MRIAHVITGLSIGGAETLKVSLLTEMQKESPEHEHVVIFFKDGSLRSKIEALGVKTHCLAGRFFTYSPASLWRLSKICHHFKPDSIHASLWAASLFARIVGWWQSIPVITDLHSRSDHIGKLRMLAEWLPIPKPSVIVAVSDDVKKTFHDYFVPERVLHHFRNAVVIENGVDQAKFSYDESAEKRLRSLYRISPDTFVVGAVGRLVPVKRYDLLIKAFAQFKQRTSGSVALCIVGDGPERSKLEALARQHGLDEVVYFVGQQTDLAQFYALFDCFAVTSDSEGLSIALLEALASGLQVLTTGNNSKHDVIKDGKNGFVTDIGDASGLARGLVAMKTIKKKNEVRPCLLPGRYCLTEMSLHYANLYKKMALKA